jgi:glycosyltransferase involved in cell wall biosynthesis|tara:strand:+ start:923 stop:1888 length:966 start_codon:yes stop_codon:yes gene_type:complete
MYKGQNVNVIVPAYNEEELIQTMLSGVPEFIDGVIVIDDCSSDATNSLVEAAAVQDQRIQLITHPENMGLGQSLIDGYLASLETVADITVVMAGDNQMDPADLPTLLDTLIDGGNDYVKGNRLLHADVHTMPRYRYLGNSLLTLLTKFATGYYALMDPQCGYTAIKNSALSKIPIEKMTKGYGYNADILTMLNIQQFSVSDCEVRPVYETEISSIKVSRYIPRIVWLLTKLFIRRLWWRHVILDFHPLVLFYTFGISLVALVSVPLSVRFVYVYAQTGELPKTTAILCVVSLMTAIQSILFAMWMDMEYGFRRRAFHGVGN